MADLQDEYEELLEEVRVGSVAGHELQITEFFRIYSTLAAENGDTPDMDYCPVLKEGSGGYRVDGYALGMLSDDSSEAGDLYLAVCDYRQEADMPAVNSRDVDRAVDGVERFFKAAMSQKFLASLEEASPAYQLAALIQQYGSRIRRLRVILFTNCHLRVRKSLFETRDVGSVTLHVNVLDLERYARISSVGGEPVEIDFDEDFGGAIECLPVSTGAESYQSYLFAMSGSALAKVFAAFGNRLLEQNVRSYLQARTSVNKGILRTIAEEPGMFFAYNNGITATASSVDIRRLEEGGPAISHIRDFQIVNGGQTTASLLYARDGLGRDLDQVYVQVKLSVVDEGRLEEVVPCISEYANTQNKVSLADLASNSPVQIRIERLSKDVSVPQRAGSLHSSKWFYERARGQYKNLFAYKSKAERSRLELTYPKSQLLTKTDLAKYELAFEGKPHHVSEGAQKCFSRFTSVLAGLDDASKITETWFRRAVAKALLFLRLDEIVQKSEWYRSDRGYKAQIVTYTIAACAEGFRAAELQIDLDRIWREQEVPRTLLDWMFVEAWRVSEILKSPPESVRNVSEFAKREFCWAQYVKGRVGLPGSAVKQYGVSLQEYADETRHGQREAIRNQEIDFDIALFGLADRAVEIMEQARQSGAASPKNMDALKKLAAGRLTSLSKGEKGALKYLLERLEIEY
ncbi:AIPR family protein [Pseudomonas aeruginosa]|uniref:AIPR family protein n=1 Tax=Pseudomonas aeruginosa TaxID=287 RepID=UPI000BB988AF|nr:AIPR family protein [Pseudomonas aeruginosa]ELC7284357.1 AIPR family protein [Pseudomonas aeruginosa]ELM3820301.1 AIPR family protein [Pseudomonas aeruginosa]ELN9535333.1 AIPR family protein [Pseudomonas aeruginosa]MBH8747916.1 AIPR family protein [Pseudomonas aeruginosa]MBX6105939.1 AIPR family protein [Pseudomonas aeruginosa]